MSEQEYQDNDQGKTVEIDRKNMHGALISYKDDQLNESVTSALRRKARIRYRCMDSFANFLAFGTSSGAIYLFKLEPITHSACTLISMIPCDQGSIEVIKFLPNHHTDDLLIIIGTSHGSLVVFTLTQYPGEQCPTCNELYRAKNFTNNCAVKIIEYDQDSFNQAVSIAKIYICDSANRLYVLDGSSIYSTKQNTLKLLYYRNTPAPILSLKDSNINQISVHKSQLLISSDETTRLFNEHTNEISVIGKKKRREGYYGACFFNPNYKPNRYNQVQQQQQQQHSSSRQSFATSNSSLDELEDILMFVSRPMFRLWQVNNQQTVMFTHQFKPLIKKNHLPRVIEMRNQPYSANESEDPDQLLDSEVDYLPRSDHFQKLMPIYSSTLGNLILSHNEFEIFVVDPIGAKLIVRYKQESPIMHISCNENEIFIWSTITSDKGQKYLNVSRLVLLAPTQIVLELHRIHRYLSLIVFVQAYAEIFKHIMALPLSGPGVVTTEGGLLRNVLLNAWVTFKSDENSKAVGKYKEYYDGFKVIIDEIVEEGRQLRQSFENLNDSRLFLTMTNENIERLYTEPYTSLMSLDISIANLHTNHIIHFSKEALNRHKSVANISQSIKNLKKLRHAASSTRDLNELKPNHLLEQPPQPLPSSINGLDSNSKSGDAKVIVERQRPTKRMILIENSKSQTLISEENSQPETNAFSAGSIDKLGDDYNARRTSSKDLTSDASTLSAATSVENGHLRAGEPEAIRPEIEGQSNPGEIDLIRCTGCQWPRQHSHLRQMHSSQQIQYNWIKENLLPNFEENVDDIEARAFKHGLWGLYLKCLAHKNNLEDYIKCCMLLDDIRLLKVEQFIIKYGEEEIMDRLLQHLNCKIDTCSVLDQSTIEVTEDVEICLNCHRKLNKIDDELLMTDNRDNSSGVSINLINLFQIMMRRHSDIKKSVSRLLQYPKVLNRSKIPANFYLKAIANATLAASHSNINRI